VCDLGTRWGCRRRCQRGWIWLRLAVWGPGFQLELFPSLHEGLFRTAERPSKRVLEDAASDLRSLDVYGSATQLPAPPQNMDNLICFTQLADDHFGPAVAAHSRTMDNPLQTGRIEG
jgi:hypothetical protein